MADFQNVGNFDAVHILNAVTNHLFKKLHKKSQPQDFTLNESPVAGLLYGNRFLVFKGSLLLLLLSLFFLLSIFQFDMQPIQH